MIRSFRDHCISDADRPCPHIPALAARSAALAVAVSTELRHEASAPADERRRI